MATQYAMAGQALLTTSSPVFTNVTSTGVSISGGSNTVDATAGGVTLTASKMVNSIYAHAPTGAVNDATDTATALLAAMPGAVIGSTFTFFMKNTSAGANTITITAGTGVTLSGTMTIAQNTVREFFGYVTAVSTPAVTLFSVSSSTF